MFITMIVQGAGYGNYEVLGQQEFHSGISVVPRKGDHIKVGNMFMSKIVEFVQLDYKEQIIRVFVK
ncbi:hypothetical protein [Clostridium cylindrosporum]|nr:hypothetical protein [Clostridium cylindrosporum]